MRYPSRQSEQVLFRELFWNTDSVRDNSGTLVGSPTVANGVKLDGSTQRVIYPLNQMVINGKTTLTWEMWFTPDGAANENIARYFWDTTIGAGARFYCLRNAGTNTIQVGIGTGTPVAEAALAAYQAYWNVGKPNHIAVCAVSGSTQVYLNDNLIVTSATAWVLNAQSANLTIGMNTSAALYFFAGTIHSFSIYSVKWDANEVEDAFKKQTFTEMAFSKAVVHLPCKSIYANTGDGVMLGTDMNMEAADTSAWTAQNSATLTKETGTRTGGSGTKVLRIAYNGVNNPGASQSSLLAAGKYYRITGWARGDNTGVPRFYYSGGSSTLVWSGTSSTTWQSFDIIAITGTGNVSFTLTNVISGAGYVEFDDITVQEVDFLTENTGTGADVKVGDSGLYGVTQAPYNGFVYDGSNSFLDCGSDVAGTSAGTFAALVQPSSFGESDYGRLFDNGTTVFAMYGTNANFRFANNVTTKESATGSATIGNYSTVIVTRTLAGAINFYVNGVLSGTADQTGGALVAGTTNMLIGNVAARTRTFNGTIKYPTIWTNFQATPTQVREIHNKLISMLNK